MADALVAHSFPQTAAAVRPAREPLLSMRSLRSGLTFTAIASAVLAAALLWGLDGWRYYGTPLATRGYDQAHRLLRPSGPVGQSLGVLGTAVLFMPFFYMIRKRLQMLKAAGNMKTWLEVHIFCGIFGPVLITFHTSFKFNGLVSVAYWSMVTVMLSGIVGRYLYVRIPRSIRGRELTGAELDAQARDLLEELSWTTPPELLQRIEQFERAVVPAPGTRTSLVGAMLGALRIKRELRALTRTIEQSDAGLDPSRLQQTVQLIAERASLLVRVAYLESTKRWFELWHVFHLPLVWVMFVIVTLHVAVVLYMGYVPFRW